MLFLGAFLLYPHRKVAIAPGRNHPAKLLIPRQVGALLPGNSRIPFQSLHQRFFFPDAFLVLISRQGQGILVEKCQGNIAEGEILAEHFFIGQLSPGSESHKQPIISSGSSIVYISRSVNGSIGSQQNIRQGILPRFARFAHPFNFSGTIHRQHRTIFAFDARAHDVPCHQKYAILLADKTVGHHIFVHFQIRTLLFFTGIRKKEKKRPHPFGAVLRTQHRHTTAG